MCNFKEYLLIKKKMLKLKKYFINQSLNHSFRTLLISLFLTLFVFWGIKTFRLDDDLVKTFPQDLPSKIIWDSIVDEFGQTEFVFVSFGRLNHNILNDKYALKQNQIFTDAVLVGKYLTTNSPLTFSTLDLTSSI